MKRMQDMNTADRNMARTLILIVLGTAALVALWAAVIGMKVGFGVLKGRTNPSQNGTPRVYDYADMLTDEQEEALEKKIAAAQKGISADIVIVIMNESIEAKYPDLIYMRSDESGAYEGIKRYTESFWIDQGFGWNEAGNTGNGIIMVDNIYRESNGWVYNWVAGAGDLRFSVGDDNCEKLSQSFTDRLPYGDMPKYSQTYADALMDFVDDCSTFGQKLRGMLGWRLYTPNAMFRTIGSSMIASVIVFILLCVIFGRMVWHLHYNGVQKKGRSPRKRRKEGILSGLRGFFGMVLLYILYAVSPALGGVALIVMIVVYCFADRKSSRCRKSKKADTAEEPFAKRGMLTPDLYRISEQNDRLVRRYTTSYTQSTGGGSSGGGGGFSGGGGGGGGGGFSGGGSHR